jgi:parallel beta-helix repeat protein
MVTSTKGLPSTLAFCLLGALLAVVAVGSVQAEGLAQAGGSAQAASAVVGPGESIQKAVDAADPGDTIVVRGVHREDVVIRKNGIKLRGDDAVIEAPTRAEADSPCSRTFGPEAICVFGDANLRTGKVNRSIKDVSISGFTIRGFKQKPNKGYSTIMIDVFGARNATVEGNHVVGNNGAGIGITAEGLNNTIENNDLINNNDDGVFVEGQRNTTIADNTFKGNADNSPNAEGQINLQTNINILIKGNDVTGGSTSIWTEDSRGTKFLSNTLRRYEFLGILIGGPKVANAKVVGNDISGGAYGIFVSNSHRGSFVGNQLHNNCAGLAFFADVPETGNSVGNYEVVANKVTDNTRKCPGFQDEPALSGIGIGLFGAEGMEVRGNHLSGNVPSVPTPVSGGVVVGVDPLLGGTTKPTNNSIVANDFGRNKPDIFFDKSGTGNRFRANNCNTSIPASLCN